MVGTKDIGLWRTQRGREGTDGGEAAVDRVNHTVVLMRQRKGSPQRPVSARGTWGGVKARQGFNDGRVRRDRHRDKRNHRLS